MTIEHVFPRWVSEVLGKSGKHWVTFIRPKQGRRDWTSDDIEITVKMPCAQCNTGWMHDLETSARPLLSHMMTNGKRRAITVADRRILAGWTAKTVTVLEYRGEDRPYYTADDRRALKDHLIPPDAVRIWMGRYLGRARAHWTVQRLSSKLTDSSWATGHCVTMSLGQLVIQVLSRRTEDGHFQRDIPIQADPWAMSLLLVWPIAPEESEITWPTDRHFNDGGLAAVCERFTDRPPPIRWRVSRRR